MSTLSGRRARGRARRRPLRPPRGGPRFFRHEQLIVRALQPRRALRSRAGLGAFPHALGRRAERERCRRRTTPRALRDHALVEFLSRRPERERGGRLDRTGVAATSARPWSEGQQGADVPIGRAPRRPQRALDRAVPTSRRTGPSFPERPGGPLTRAGDLSHLAGGGTRPRPGAITLICSGTRSRRTCSREVPICAASRRCSGMPTWRRRSSTRTSPTPGAGASTSRRIRTRAGDARRTRLSALPA